MSSQQLDKRKDLAQKWFENLQSSLITIFEDVETEAGSSDLSDYSKMPNRKFKRSPWTRGDGKQDQGGGTMAMLRGRVFEKAGIHSSTVYGEFSEEFRKQIPGAEEDPRFWASGISLIAHPRNPHTPAAHMNTRMIVTTKCWFGGGGDLNPMMDIYRSQDHEDTILFHEAMKVACDKHDNTYFPKFKKWCEDYFFLPHRNEARGVGGIFYDRLDSNNWDKDFAFTKDVGTAFLSAYPTLVKKRMNTPWNNADKKEQLFRRGRYAEYNLLYDRGTTFGLKTGGNVESILSSLPPLAAWE